MEFDRFDVLKTQLPAIVAQRDSTKPLFEQGQKDPRGHVAHELRDAYPKVQMGASLMACSPRGMEG